MLVQLATPTGSWDHGCFLLLLLSSPLQPVRRPNIPIDFKSLSLSAAGASSGQSDPFADATKRERLNAILGMKVTNPIFRPTSLSPEVREKRYKCGHLGLNTNFDF